MEAHSAGRASTDATPKHPTRRLGRGLSSLVSAGPITVEAPPPENPAQVNTKQDVTLRGGVLDLPLDRITPSLHQPRKHLDEAALARLAESVRQHGVLQPVVVRRGAGDMYELIAGERRWRAAQLAGLRSIPAVVKEVGESQAAELALIENVQREDLNPMERAWALRTLCERFGLTQQDAAERVGFERSSIANLIRLTELEPDIAELIASGKLSPGHGKALLQTSAGASRVALARRAAAEEWNVRRLEDATRNAAPFPKKKPADENRDAVLRDLERRISQHLGTKVRIKADRSGKKGTLTFDFYSLDHFDSLMMRLGINDRA